jgi:MFS-type transporter involved in bile tolerance (Atg22 family)
LRRLSPRGIGVGGVALVVVFRLSTLLLGLFVDPYWDAIDSGMLGCVSGGFIAARLAQNAKVLNATCASWSAIALIVLAIRLAAQIYGKQASLTILYGALIVAIACCTAGGYASLRMSRRDGVEIYTNDTVNS